MLPIVLALSLPLPVTISPQDEKSKEEEPEEERGVLVHEPTATPGYTLFSPLASTSVYLVNNDGEVVHSWETEYTPGSMVYLRGNGNLIRGGHVGSDRFKGGGMGGLGSGMARANHYDIKLRMFHVKHSLLSKAETCENFVQQVLDIYSANQ